ncbi:unnamed protein product [Rotaria socialis]|uniref:NAD(P)(+)--arginine ADP-ribosyltransferase n=1 Tax=Rotaria socialis TaxID=392032 RepID=A0A820VGI9_9BILA|nr:unnamed protein product [Rotaria socialis]CAF3388489.1 unnamed protein product [Rotaria socialis]CAF3423103.1 unnamed protein product [Rotaria socialis]CAF3456998.1 unnamed protein product [Rotaria socialis]CAF4499726.1 unnamed protein product [Rotaria socialis]
MASAYEHVAHDWSRFADVVEESRETFSQLQGYEIMPLVSLEKATDPLIPHVPEIAHMVDAVRRNLIEPKDGLTNDESASIMLYSMQWIPKECSFYHALNKTLRDINREKLIPPWLLYLRLFMTALAKIPSTPGEQVYRGIKKDLRQYYRVGSCFIWAGFSSCTPHIHLLEKAPFFGQTDTRTLLSIHCETGKNIKEHSFSHTEDEIVFMPGAEFEVISTLDMNHALHVIHLKEIQNRFPHAPSILPSHVTSTAKKTCHINAKMKPASQSPTTQNEESQKQEHSSDLEKKVQKLTDADVQRIIDESLVRKQCIELDMSWNKITDVGASLIAKALTKNQTLLTLDLKGNDIDEIGAEYFADVLRHNKTLTTLNLGGDLFFGYNSIGDTGVKHIADALRENQTLTTLDIGSNQIGDMGAEYVANALKENTTLISLNVFENQISEIGAEYLGQALKQNSTLKTLNLAVNKIGTVGAQHLGDALHQNKKLTVLNLEHNQIKNLGAQHLAGAIRHNSTLTTLDLRQNEISDSAVEHFAVALLHNIVIDQLL